MAVDNYFNTMARTLTKKQRDFVKEYIKTGNGVKSALVAYDTKDNLTARVISSENLTKPNIKAYLEESGFTTNNAKRVVAEIMNDKRKTPMSRLKATELVFKVNKDFTETVNNTAILVQVGNATAEKYGIDSSTGSNSTGQA